MFTHSVLNMKVPEVRLDLYQSVFDIKKVCERKFGTPVDCMSLVLQDRNGNSICTLSEDDRNFGFYTP